MGYQGNADCAFAGVAWSRYAWAVRACPKIVQSLTQK